MTMSSQTADKQAIAPEGPVFSIGAEGPGRAFVQELKDLFGSLELLRVLTVAYIRSRYKRSVVGVLWALLNPLLMTAIFAAVFSNLFSPSVWNYPVYLLVGLNVWNFLAQSTLGSMHTMLWGSHLIRGIRIPRAILALSVLSAELIHFVIALGCLVAILPVLGHPIGPAVFFLPVALLVCIAFVCGISLLGALIAVYFSDIIEIVSVALCGLFFLTPVFYPQGILPDLLATLVRLNPVTVMIDLFRLPLYQGIWPDATLLTRALGWSALSLLSGLVLFLSRSDEIPYRI